MDEDLHLNHCQFLDGAKRNWNAEEWHRTDEGWL
jgi:hypothetical protein